MTHNEPLADTRDMYMAHNMFRREIGLIPALVRSVDPGDVDRANVISDHLELVLQVLHHHHVSEDSHLWPRLLTRGADEVAPVVDVMESQHDGIATAVAEVTTLTAQWRDGARPADGTALADAVERLSGLLVEHLAVEEDKALPLIERFITAAEWHAMVAEGGQGFPPEQLPLLFGLMAYEGDPEIVREAIEQMPPEVRSIIPGLASEAFAQHSKLVHGTATPARIGARA